MRRITQQSEPGAVGPAVIYRKCVNMPYCEVFVTGGEEIDNIVSKAIEFTFEGFARCVGCIEVEAPGTPVCRDAEEGRRAVSGRPGSSLRGRAVQHGAIAQPHGARRVGRGAMHDYEEPCNKM